MHCLLPCQQTINQLILPEQKKTRAQSKLHGMSMPMELFGLDYDDSPESSPESDSEEGSGPSSKRRRCDGAAKYPTKFNPDWSKRWPCIQVATREKFRCNICQCLVSFEHQGQKDVRRHIEGKKHCDNMKGHDNQRQISAFFKPTAHPIHDKVTRAEVKVCTVLAYHNIPIALSDHLSPLFRDIFPDSEIARAYSCARTKTTCILNGAVAKHLQSSLIEHMLEEPFSLATDGSNDSGLQKMNPLTVRYFDVNRGRVSTQLLDMCLTSVSTAEEIFAKINDTLVRYNIDWNLCVAFGVDNTSVNLGRRNSIKTRVHQQNGSVYFVGCPCHMVHNTASKASEAFEAETGFAIEDILVDLYYWFDKSTKRKNELASFCEFCDTTYRQIIKHVSTRWLSLENAVGRALQQYSALKSYFLSSNDTQARMLRLQQQFSKPITEVYLMFYQAVMPIFTSLNKCLQRENPCIHILHNKLSNFFVKILSKFVKIQVIKDEDNVTDVDFSSSSNQLERSKIFIGFMTKQLLRHLLDDGDISNSEVNKFYSGVLKFYTIAAQYILATYPLNDDVLYHAKLLNFESREDIEFDSLEYFIERFPHLHELRSPREIDILHEEFVSYQLLNNTDIPANIWEEAKVREGDEAYYRIDTLWGYVCNIKVLGSTDLKFPRLLKVIKSVIVIPHSNASEERVFSMVRKNKTPFRPSIGLDGTLSSIITVKLGVHEPSEKFEPSKSLLTDAKKSTWEYNKTHSSKHT